ncbi:MAG: hypothetical protein GKR94_02795 [Gammaproteobacteria bacterium]|nr:hypothetical protein [Gammaproteobacteria bacterium]
MVRRELIDAFVREAREIAFSESVEPERQAEKVEAAARETLSNLEAENLSRLRGERRLRTGMAIAMIVLFVCLNAAVIYLVFEAAHFDREMIQSKRPEYNPVITENVYMSLIGGVVVQAGAVFVAIARYLFPIPTSSKL